ncbi:MAG: hypothetical protein NTU53_07675 [Planctomycetota bacterium]|nr:hypothetical protein [Planctomycetota bacterium]
MDVGSSKELDDHRDHEPGCIRLFGGKCLDAFGGVEVGVLLCIIGEDVREHGTAELGAGRAAMADGMDDLGGSSAAFFESVASMGVEADGHWVACPTILISSGVRE